MADHPEPNSFADPKMAMRARDALSRIMIKKLDEVRPPYQYGTITQIDADLRTCQVVLTGDTDPVTVAFGGSRPTMIGQVVRVAGKRGDRFIEDTMGGAVSTDPDPSDLDAPLNFDMGPTPQGVNSRWDPVLGAYNYELQLADDVAFTTNVRVYTTGGTGLIETPLASGQLVYGRVRALTSYGAPGAWSATDSINAGFFDILPSDGTAPASSPTAVITGALGFIIVEWLPTSNVDPVTYEVHISTTNGFTPSGATKIGETSGTFFMARQDASNVNLLYGTTYYFRLIAKDNDGAAAAGGQGSGQMQQVGSIDVSQIPLGEIGDGVPPSSSPVPTVTNGIGYLYITFTQLATFDYTVYDVHVSSVNGFTPSSATLVGGTINNFFFIRKLGSGAGGGPLAYNVLYYVKIVARDVDGVAAASAQASGTALQADTADLHVGAITAGSAIIANLAVDTALIANAAITNAKIGALAVDTAQIALLAVDTAQINNAAIATAKIGNLQVTDAKINDLTATKITAGTISAQIINLGSGGTFRGGSAPTGAGFLLNDQGFSLYNSSAVRTVYLDATTGNITVVGGSITGSLFKTAGTGARVTLNDGTLSGVPYIGLYGPSQSNPSAIWCDNTYIMNIAVDPNYSDSPQITLDSSNHSGNSIIISSGLASGSAIGLQAAYFIDLDAPVVIIDGDCEVDGNLNVAHGSAYGGPFGGYAFTFLDYDGNNIHFENDGIYRNGSQILAF